MTSELNPAAVDGKFPQHQGRHDTQRGAEHIGRIHRGQPQAVNRQLQYQKRQKRGIFTVSLTIMNSKPLGIKSGFFISSRNVGVIR